MSGRSATDGMSLRDYFAGQAIGHLASTHSDTVFVARIAFEIADAMLAARSTPTHQEKADG